MRPHKSGVGAPYVGLAPARQAPCGFNLEPALEPALEPDLEPRSATPDVPPASLEEVIRMLSQPFGGASSPMSQSSRPKKRARCAEEGTTTDKANLEANLEVKARAPRRVAAHKLPPSPARSPGPRPSPSPNLLPMEGALKRWFDEEVETLQRLAHTQRLKGDYVAAQTMEREIRWLALQTAAVLRPF